MNVIKKLILLILQLLLLIPLTMFSQGIKGLKGNITILDQANLSVSQKIKQAEERFLKAGQGSYFLTGYTFSAKGHGQISGTHITTHDERISTIIHEQDRLRIIHYGSWDSDREKSKSPVEREVLFLHRKKSRGSEIVDISLLNTNGKYEIKTLPLYWLGTVPANDSMKFLTTLYKTPSMEMKKRLLPVIAYQCHPEACSFLYGVAKNESSENLRKKAVFWMGVSRDAKAVGYLKKIFSSDSSATVRKQVVFALYLHKSKPAIQELIKIAKKGESTSLRKKAIFWLGQRASNEAVKTLTEIIKSKDDIKVKSSAVFAISQLPKDKAVPLLIDIAKNHKSRAVKKKAIFWLGQIGDERAIQFFEKILLK